MTDTKQGIFSGKYCLTAEYCDENRKMSALAPFMIYQSIAMQHNEKLGNGANAARDKGKYWLVSHTRVNYYDFADLMQTVTAETWPERCGERSVRLFRDYRIRAGSNVISEGKTQWVICGDNGEILPFSQTGFKRDFPYPDETVDVSLSRLTKSDACGWEHCADYAVRRSDLDFMGHMNNVSYVRLILDSMSPEDGLLCSALSYIEIHYIMPCFGREILGLFSARNENKYCFEVRNSEGKTAARAVVAYRT